MELFYIPEVEGDRVVLEDDQFRHAVKALRKKEGDAISFTDGTGLRYDGAIDELQKRKAYITIRHRAEMPPPNFNVSVAVALTKNTKRSEWALEKMTEMGIKRFIPIYSAHSERDTANDERLHKIAVSAMKQSGQCYLPEIQPMVSFEECLRDTDNFEVQKLIAAVSEKERTIPHNYRRGSDVLILIGPEGGFSADEIDMAKDASFVPVSLGINRLRTETAAVFAVAAIHTLNQ